MSRWKTLTSDRPGVEAGLCLFPAVHTLLSACGIPQETPMGPTEVQKGRCRDLGGISLRAEETGCMHPSVWEGGVWDLGPASRRRGQGCHTGRSAV